MPKVEEATEHIAVFLKLSRAKLIERKVTLNHKPHVHTNAHTPLKQKIHTGNTLTFSFLM